MEGSHLTSFVNRLSAGDLLAIQDGFTFTESDVIEELRLTRERFCDLLSLLVPKKGTRKDFLDLFDKVDISCEGVIDWEKLCAFLLLEYYEKEDKVKATNVPQWKYFKVLPCLHRAQICSILRLNHAPRYCTVSKDGLVCFMNMDFSVTRKVHVNMDPEEIKTRDLWITSACAMWNINKLALSATSKEILIYDLSSKADFVCQYKLYGIDCTPLCMDYWYNEYNHNHAILSFGDTEGNVRCLFFRASCTGLFDKPLNSDVSQETCYAVHILEVAKGQFPSAQYLCYHPHTSWVRQVKYLPLLDCFVSCATTSTDSMVLGWFEKACGNIRTSTFKIMLGFGCFDYHQRLNVIATAGLSNFVSLWNPFVASKTVGILRGHMQVVVGVKFIEEKSLLISLSKDNVLRVWDVNLQICLQRLSGIFPKKPDGQLKMLFDSSNSCLLASFNSQLVALRMKADTKNHVTSHEAAVNDIAYSYTSQLLVSVCEDSSIALWFVDTGQRIKQFKNAHGDSEITCVALDEFRAYFLTGSTDGSVKVWDLNGNCRHVLVVANHSPCDISRILCLKQFVIVVGWSRQVCCFDMSKVQESELHPCEWLGREEHTDDIFAAEFIEPRILATGAYNGEIVLWNVATQNAFRHINKLTSPFGKPPYGLPSVEKEKLYRKISEPSGGDSISSLSCKKAHVLDKQGMEFRPSFSMSATDLVCDRLCPALNEALDEIVTRLISLRSRSSKHPFSADLIACHGDGTVSWWNSLTGELLGRFSADSLAESLVGAVDARNLYLVTGSHSGLIKVWEISNYCLQENSSLYEPPKFPNEVKRTSPPVLAEIAAHFDVISAILVLERNGVTLVVTASRDASIRMHTLSGELVGVYGQENHWQIPTQSIGIAVNASASRQEDAVASETLVPEEALPYMQELPEAQTTFFTKPFQDIEDEKILCFAAWDRTLLGKAYGEDRKAKRAVKYNLRNVSSVANTRNSEKIADVSSYEKSDLLNKYGFCDSSKGNAIPSTSANELKTLHDEKSLFPKHILELEAKMKTAHRFLLQRSKNTVGSASRPNTQAFGR